MNGGPGDDELDAVDDDESGTTDTITCGSGEDSVLYDPADDVITDIANCEFINEI
jgi:hypothetical protein